MRFLTSQKPPAESEQPKLSVEDRYDLWSRICVSAIYLGVTVVLFFLLFYTVTFLAFPVLIIGLALSLIVPHWPFRHQARLKNHLWLSAFYFGLTLFVVILQLVIFNAPELFLIFSITTGLALSLILPHFRYREWIYSFLILIAWFILVSVSMPPLMKQYRLIMAANIIPPYTALTLTDTFYSPGSFPDVEGGSGYSYYTTTPEEDYIKMKEFYQAQFSKKGWVTCGGYISPSQDQGYTWFCKKVNSLTFVSVFYNVNQNKVGVGLSY